MSYYTTKARLSPEQLMMLKLSGNPQITTQSYHMREGLQVQKQKMEQIQQRNNAVSNKSIELKQDMIGNDAIGGSVGGAINKNLPRTISNVAKETAKNLINDTVENFTRFSADRIYKKYGHGEEFDKYMSKLENMVENNDKFVKPMVDRLNDQSAYDLFHVRKAIGNGLKNMSRHIFDDDDEKAIKHYRKAKGKGIIMKKKFANSLEMDGTNGASSSGNGVHRVGAGIYKIGAGITDPGYNYITQIVYNILKKNNKHISLDTVIKAVKKLSSGMSQSVNNWDNVQANVSKILNEVAPDLQHVIGDLRRNIPQTYISKLNNITESKKQGMGIVENKQGVIGYGEDEKKKSDWMTLL
jgi:hypothetical protein